MYPVPDRPIAATFFPSGDQAMLHKPFGSFALSVIAGESGKPRSYIAAGVETVDTRRIDGAVGFKVTCVIGEEPGMV